jgi:MFS family permease
VKLEDYALVFVLAAAGAFIGMVFTVVSPVLPLIIEHFGAATHGALIAQWILTIPSIGIVVGGPPVGWLVDQLGSRRVFLSCFAIYALAGSAGLYVQNPFLFLVTRLILGMGAAGLATAATIVIGEHFADGQRGRVLGLQSAIGVPMGIAVTLTSGALGAVLGWRAPFELYSISILVMLLGFFVIPPAQETRRRQIDRGSLAAFVPLMTLYGLVTITFMMSFFVSTAVPERLAAEGNAAPAVISLAIGTGLAVYGVAAFFYGAIRKWAGLRWTVALGLGAQGIGVLWIALAHGTIGIIIGGAVLSVGSGIQTPNLSHLVLDRAPIEIRGRALGFLFTAQFLGPFLNTLIFAPAANAFGLPLSLTVVSVLVGAGVIAIILRSRAWRRPASTA